MQLPELSGIKVEWSNIINTGKIMDIDNITEIKANDPQGMLQYVLALPDQLETAWQLGKQTKVGTGEGIRQVIIAGMGGSAIGADLIEAYTRSSCSVPVFVHRDYGLPAWAVGAHTLVIASSHSGNTEETLSAFATAQERHCRTVVLSTGGALKEKADSAGSPVMLFTHDGQPRAAVGFSFGLLLAAFSGLNLIPDQEGKLHGAVECMKSQMKSLIPESPVNENPAKRLAGQLLERLPVVVGADILNPVARRWKSQFNELAKSWSQFDYLPEFDHNSLAGLEVPEKVLSQMVVIFLKAAANENANQLRIDLSRRVMMTEGINTDIVIARGENDLEQIWSLVHLGDFTAYYLACLSGKDPTPIPAISLLKQEMQQARS